MMKEIKEKELEFVARFYDRDRFDTEEAIKCFHDALRSSTPRRWWMVAAATAASIAIAFAAGYTIYLNNTDSDAPATQTEHVIHNPNVAQTHMFIYDKVPLQDVLDELSEYYGCKLKTDATGKKLTL